MKTILTKNPAGKGKSLIIAAFLASVLLLAAPCSFAETYTKSFTYDLNGNIATRTTPDNAIISYTYDGVNRLTDIDYPDGKKVSFTYDGNGNRLSMTDPTGTTWYGYDSLNRLAAVQPPDIIPIYYGHDRSGNLTKVTYPDGAIVTYEYDSSNRLSKVIGPTGATTYEYDNNSNNLTKKTLPNNTYTLYTYDTAKRITDLVNKKSDGSIITSHHYEFDANGNRTRAVETTPDGTKTTDYTYDKLNRLTNATCSDGAYETYTYDSSGNRLTKTTQNGTISYTYDGDNRLIKIGTATGNTALFYDRSGNLMKKISATKTVTYVYDYENRLVSYADGANTVAFAYDGDGNRVAKTVNGVTTKYVNDISSPISQVLLETDGQSKVTARYIYDGNGRLSQTRGDSQSYYIYDNPGRSVAAVLDGTQAVLNNYAYNAFGDIKTINEMTPNDFLYAGEQYDDETGLIYLRKRYYDPETGRFLSKDAFPGYVTDPQTVNPYPYVQNNPVNRIDPTGLFTPPEYILGKGYISGPGGPAATAIGAAGGVLGAGAGAAAGTRAGMYLGMEYGAALGLPAGPLGSFAGALLGGAIGYVGGGISGEIIGGELGSMIGAAFDKDGAGELNYRELNLNTLKSMKCH